jgi:hypothetical protein
MEFQYILVCLSFIRSATCYYILGSQLKTFADAVSECNSINAHVVLPKTESEDNFIKGTYLTNNKWYLVSYV